MRLFLRQCVVLLMSLAAVDFAWAQAKEQAQKVVPLYMQEALDAAGHQIPDAPGIHQFIVFFEREAQVRFQLHHLPWNRAKSMVAEGRGIIWGFSKNIERLGRFDFSEPVLISNIWAIVYGKPKTPITQVDDLKGLTISVERGVSHGMDFEMARGRIFKVDEDAASAPIRFRKLMAGRSDALLWGLVQFNEHQAMQEYIQNKYIPSMNDAHLKGEHFYVSTRPIFNDSLHFASAKGKFPEEMQRINKAIKRGLKSGELSKILRELE